MRYFIDANGWVWCLNQDGKSNHPARVAVEGDDTVHVLDRDGAVHDSYTLHPSLKALAAIIEAD